MHIKMKVSTRTIMMSHLSDMSIEHDYGIDGNIQTRINFIKFLLMKYPDTSAEIDADGEFDQFKKTPQYQSQNN